MQFIVHNVEHLQPVITYLTKLLKKTPLVLLYGTMGAGKTTLVSLVAKTLGVKQSTSSPTFSIVNEYLYPKGKIFHFDLYRIANEAELQAIGFDDYLFSGEICFIEWPEHAGKLLNDVPHIQVTIQQEGNDRIIDIVENV
ncbi:MAG: tRNA (adenosine(37)-N6)-threonylcarbamoyltransferase complex ATPase subunit type 1 TsaE [Flavobacteriales bacterium]|nr:tRNA (adenosine(37)-N6)-threonylcarbamoyltransferase complex ATPase subunit type 1 TsaE [Flavobacteriales bacterium]